MAGDINSEIKLFFEDPTVPLDTSKECSVLKFLLCNIYTCFGKKIDSNDGDLDMPFQPLWAGAMCVFAGIDLLAKFLKGSDAQTRNDNSGIRFKEYMDNYMPGTNGHIETLYQLRNSLVHSFGWYSEDKDNNIYRFRLSRNGQLVDAQNNNIYMVNILKLLDEFAQSIASYKNDLENDSEGTLKSNFDNMYSRYGVIEYGLEPQQGSTKSTTILADIGYGNKYSVTSPDSSGAGW
ncbi:MAG: hypothetical protein ABFD64_07020 [Armatimonadota bacterium]